MNDPTPPVPATLDALLSATLVGAIRPALREVLAEVLPEEVRRATAKPYYTIAEAMELTGLSRRKLDYMRERREIGFVKRGRLVLFPSAAVHDYLDAGLVAARRQPKRVPAP